MRFNVANPAMPLVTQVPDYRIEGGSPEPRVRWKSISNSADNGGHIFRLAAWLSEGDFPQISVI